MEASSKAAKARKRATAMDIFGALQLAPDAIAAAQAALEQQGIAATEEGEEGDAEEQGQPEPPQEFFEGFGVLSNDVKQMKAETMEQIRALQRRSAYNEQVTHAISQQQVAGCIRIVPSSGTKGAAFYAGLASLQKDMQADIKGLLSHVFTVGLVLHVRATYGTPDGIRQLTEACKKLCLKHRSYVVIHSSDEYSKAQEQMCRLLFSAVCAQHNMKMKVVTRRPLDKSGEFSLACSTSPEEPFMNGTYSTENALIVLRVKRKATVDGKPIAGEDVANYVKEKWAHEFTLKVELVDAAARLRVAPSFAERRAARPPSRAPRGAQGAPIGVAARVPAGRPAGR